jgi:hypothetical protein
VAALPEDERVKADAAFCADTIDEVSAEPVDGDPYMATADSRNPAVIKLKKMIRFVIFNKFTEVQSQLL